MKTNLTKLGAYKNNLRISKNVLQKTVVSQNQIRSREELTSFP